MVRCPMVRCLHEAMGRWGDERENPGMSGSIPPFVWAWFSVLPDERAWKEGMSGRAGRCVLWLNQEDDEGCCSDPILPLSSE